MRPSVALRTVSDHRRALIGYGLGFIGIVLMYSSFYPSIRDSGATLDEYLENLPDALRGFIGEAGEISTPVGYIQTELFSVFGPLLLLVFTIGAGARAIAGEEERRTMDHLLTTPLPRTRVVLEKAAAMAGTVAMIAVVLWAAVAVIGPRFDLGLDLGNLAAATVSCALLALVFGSLALAIGCATGNRGLAIAVTAALAVAAYIVNGLAPAVAALDPVQEWSPFYYYLGADPLRNGLDLGHAGVLAGLIALFTTLGALSFTRRDVR